MQARRPASSKGREDRHAHAVAKAEYERQTGADSGGASAPRTPKSPQDTGGDAGQGGGGALCTRPRIEDEGGEGDVRGAQGPLQGDGEPDSRLVSELQARIHELETPMGRGVVGEVDVAQCLRDMGFVVEDTSMGEAKNARFLDLLAYPEEAVTPHPW